MEEKNIRIIEWPKNKAYLEHTFDLEKPCPISIVFEDKPIPVEVNTNPKRPLNVDMNMAFSAKENIPLCIKICEPICATSDYKVGITLFGKPFAEIGIKGVTKLAACNDRPQPVRKCLRFEDCKAGKVEKSPFLREGVTYSTPSGAIRFVSLVGPPTPTQMLIENEGLKLDFDRPVNQLELNIANFANPIIYIEAHLTDGQVVNEQVSIQNSQQKVLLPVDGIRTVVLRGGSNEAALIELCYSTQ